MNIRQPLLSDKPEIDRIYSEFYSNNEYPEFFNNLENNKFQCSFVITDDSDKIILAGGVKTIAEIAVVTDKHRSTKTRLDALIQALGSAIFITQGMRYKQVHAFISGDDNYVNHLQKFGFKLMDAKILVLDLGDKSNG